MHYFFLQLFILFLSSFQAAVLLNAAAKRVEMPREMGAVDRLTSRFVGERPHAGFVEERAAEFQALSESDKVLFLQKAHLYGERDRDVYASQLDELQKLAPKENEKIDELARESKENREEAFKKDPELKKLYEKISMLKALIKEPPAVTNDPAIIRADVPTTTSPHVDKPTVLAEKRQEERPFDAQTIFDGFNDLLVSIRQLLRLLVEGGTMAKEAYLIHSIKNKFEQLNQKFIKEYDVFVERVAQEESSDQLLKNVASFYDMFGNLAIELDDLYERAGALSTVNALKLGMLTWLPEKIQQVKLARDDALKLVEEKIQKNLITPEKINEQAALLSAKKGKELWTALEKIDKEIAFARNVEGFYEHKTDVLGKKYNQKNQEQLRATPKQLESAFDDLLRKVAEPYVAELKKEAKSFIDGLKKEDADSYNQFKIQDNLASFAPVFEKFIDNFERQRIELAESDSPLKDRFFSHLDKMFLEDASQVSLKVALIFNETLLKGGKAYIEEHLEKDVFNKNPVLLKKTFEELKTYLDLKEVASLFTQELVEKFNNSLSTDENYYALRELKGMIEHPILGRLIKLFVVAEGFVRPDQIKGFPLTVEQSKEMLEGWRASTCSACEDLKHMYDQVRTVIT